MKRLFIISILILLSFLFLRCSSEKKEIVVGAIMNLTGDAGVYGQWAKSGVDLAVDQINKRGGVNGKLLKIQYEDDQAKPNLGVSAFNILLNQSNIQAIIGPLGSSVTLAVAPLANQNKVVIISPISSSPEITNAGDFIFRVWPSDNEEGKRLAEFAKNNLVYKSIAIYYMNNDYGVGLKNVFSNDFTRLGGKITIEESFQANQTDFRTTLEKIKIDNPEAIYIPGHVREIANILIQAKELGISAQILTTSAVDGPEILKLALNAAENLIFTTPSFEPNSKNKVVQNFQENYNQNYGKQAETVAAHSYDAMNILLFAINKVGYNGVAIKDELYKIKDYNGVTGIMSFDKNGDIQKKSLIKKIQNGESKIIDE